jgi:hypothetical protein
MTQRMVKVQNMVNKIVSIKKPQYNFNKRWTQKGQILPIPYETLEQMLWDDGIKKLFERGMLYIPEMKDKIDLGLEPEDAKEPQNIIVLNDKQIMDFLVNKPFVVFKKELEALSLTQIREMVNFAIVNEVACEITKVTLLKEITGVDILKSISRNLDVKAAEEKMN